jgi:hypothetical protein
MILPADSGPLLPVLDSGEELLRRAHDTAQAILERVRKAMGPEARQGPNGPAEAASPVPGSANEGGA